MNHAVHLIILSMLLASGEPLVAQNPQRPKPETAISIEAPVTETKVGSPFRLKLLLTNVTDQAITLTSPGIIDGPVYKRVGLR